MEGTAGRFKAGDKAGSCALGGHSRRKQQGFTHKKDTAERNKKGRHSREIYTWSTQQRIIKMEETPGIYTFEGHSRT
jgi:hypothetical protein